MERDFEVLGWLANSLYRTKLNVLLHASSRVNVATAGKKVGNNHMKLRMTELTHLSRPHGFRLSNLR